MEQRIGVDGSRRHGVDPDAFRSEFGGEMAHHGLEGGLGCADRGVVRDGADRSERRHGDQRLLTPGVEPDEVLDEGQQRGCVDVHGPVEVVHCQFFSRFQHSGCSVGNHDLETAPLGFDGGKDPFDVFRIGHVALDEEAADPTVLDLSCGCFGALSAAKIVDGDIDLEVRQGESNRPADASG